MSLAETIASVGGRDVVNQISEQFGLSQGMTTQAIGMLLPSLSEGMNRNVKKEGGLDALLGALSGGNHESYLSKPSALASGDTATDGNNILGHILGNKDASRGVAATVAGALGIESATIRKMLPVVATVAMGALANQSKAANLSSGSSGGDVLGQLAGMLGSGGASKILGQLFS